MFNYLLFQKIISIYKEMGQWFGCSPGRISKCKLLARPSQSGLDIKTKMWSQDWDQRMILILNRDHSFFGTTPINIMKSKPTSSSIFDKSNGPKQPNWVVVIWPKIWTILRAAFKKTSNTNTSSRCLLFKE